MDGFLHAFTLLMVASLMFVILLKGTIAAFIKGYVGADLTDRQKGKALFIAISMLVIISAVIGRQKPVIINQEMPTQISNPQQTQPAKSGVIWI